MIIVNGWKPLTIITNRSIVDAAAAVDPPLCVICKKEIIADNERRGWNNQLGHQKYSVKGYLLNTQEYFTDYGIQSNTPLCHHLNVKTQFSVVSRKTC